jgi:phosphatidate cytidylyltransferase
VLLLAVGWVAVEVLWGNVPVQQAAARFFAPWYIGLPLGMLVAVHGTAGAWATLVLIATVVVSDSAQYYTGRAFGRRPLAPAISPKKTVEGAIGGVVFGTLFLAVAGPWAIGAGIVAMGLLGLVVAVLGICGDLFESRLKRASGVKDSSSLIPGHGGVLDRIDALLFAIPAFYLYLR